MSAVDFRLLDYNYAFESGTTISATSSDASFPASNLARYHRSKMWRSSGYFEIDATNNKLNFKVVSMGAELTATLASGTYTPTTLAAEIKSKLETVSGSSPFVVTYSTVTGKWTITSPTAYFDLLFATGTNVLTDVAQTIGFPAIDYTGSLSYTGSTIAIHSYEAVTFDFATIEDINSCAILFDPSVGSNLTNSAVVKLQANATNSWSSPAVDVTLSFDDVTEMFSHYFAATQSYRYGRIKIIDTQNPDLYVQLGLVFIGKSLSFTRIPSIGFNLVLEDKSKTIETDFGHRYVDQYPIKKTLSFEMALMDQADCNILFESFNRIGIRKPVLVVLDAQELLFDRNKVTVYGYYQPSIGFSHVVRSIMNSSLTIEETF